MSEVILIKTPNGSLVPADEESQERVKKIKTGAAVRCKIAQMRNPQFHKKFFALIKYLFDIWSESMPNQTYRGVEVRPSFEKFRENLIIMTGRFDAYYNIFGDVRLEAHSISFANMEQGEFEKLYSDVIDIGLSRIMNRPDLTPEKVRRLVDQLLQYD